MRGKCRASAWRCWWPSTLHAIATGNLLPASVPTVCRCQSFRADKTGGPGQFSNRRSRDGRRLVFSKELARELGWRL